MKRNTIILVTIIVLATTLLALAIPRIILGKTADQATDDSYTSTIAETISDPTSSSPFLRQGSDFTVSNERYFNSKEWLVVTVSPVKKNAAEPAVIVLHLQDSKYTTVIGPGTTFDERDLTTLPSEVIQYLRNIGRVSANG